MGLFYFFFALIVFYFAFYALYPWKPAKMAVGDCWTCQNGSRYLELGDYWNWSLPKWQFVMWITEEYENENQSQFGAG